jgi:hypothetical protein
MREERRLAREAWNDGQFNVHDAHMSNYLAAFREIERLCASEEEGA